MQSKHNDSPKRRRGRWLLPTLAALAIFGWFENCTLTTGLCIAQSSRLPQAFDGLRVVQISDLHGMQFGRDQTRLLRRVQQAQPDLIAITGDLADEYTDLTKLPVFLQALTKLAPTFYVTGNHEWVMKKSQRQELFKILDACGVQRLENEYRLLSRGEEAIAIAGVDDPNGPADQISPAQLVTQLRQKEGDGCYILMLAHRNDQLDLWSRLGVDTVLCGHAHGGIWRLPVLGPVFGTHYDFFPEYTAGLYEHGDTDMVVSRGLGQSRRIPLRICNRPEVLITVLQSGNA